MRILVFGAGSLGSLVGGLLARTHDVALVGRDPHVAAVRENGLRIDGEIEATVTPVAVTDVDDLRATDVDSLGARSGDDGHSSHSDGDAIADRSDERGDEPDDRPFDGRTGERDERPFDLALVTVKAGDTGAAADALGAVPLGVACSLQNGLGNEERLAATLSCPVLAGTCTYGARLPEPGVVECTGVGEVAVGSRTGGALAAADDVGRAFCAAGLETAVATDMPRRLWAKLAVNAGINAVTALARVPNGALVDGPGAETAREAARETARVARANGVDLDEDAAAADVARVAETTAANASSMRQDVDAERATEVDAINGAVVDRADGPVPVNGTLTALVRAWERERGLR